MAIDLNTAREWTGAVDDDAKLQIIIDGTISLLENELRMSLACPPIITWQILNGPPARFIGLSPVRQQDDQYVTLQYRPREKLTGTWQGNAGDQSVIGSGANATTELSADPASAISFDGGLTHYQILEIASDTSVTLTEELSDAVVDAVAESPFVGIETRRTDSDSWESQDPLGFELERRRIYSRKQQIPAGNRTVRVRYRVGYDSDEFPADIEHLALDMIRSAYLQTTRDATSVAIDGAFRVTWASYGDEYSAYQMRIRDIAQAITYG